jgi:plasmid replication initiation protein
MNIDFEITKKIRQSNYLIESPYSQEFTAHEIKLFEIAMASCVIEDINFIENKSNKELKLSNIELAKLLNTKPNVISMEIEKTAKRIMKKTIHLRKILDDGTIEFEMINIIPFAKYKNGLFQFELNHKVIPYLTEINKNFTEYQLNYLLSMTSSYAIKLYKLLYQYRNIKKRIFTVVELKEQFGIIDKYPQYSNFKQRILIPSICQINKLTDLYISFDEIKIGRSVDRLEFTFKMQDKPKKIPLVMIKPEIIIEDQKINELIKNIEVELSAKTKELIVEMFKLNGIEYIEASINYAKNNAKSNLDRYLNDTLNNNWAEIEHNRIIEQNIQKVKDEKLMKQKQLEKITQENIKNEQKNIILAIWESLSTHEQVEYINHADIIFNRYHNKLSNMISSSLEIAICCFAVTNNQSYNKLLEGYCNLLDVKLSLNNN